MIAGKTHPKPQSPPQWCPCMSVYSFALYSTQRGPGELKFIGQQPDNRKHAAERGEQVLESVVT
jgi:hypothetical protein